MYFVLVRAALFILTGLIMSSLAMGRMTGNNVDGNEINDIFQPLPEVILVRRKKAMNRIVSVTVSRV